MTVIWYPSTLDVLGLHRYIMAATGGVQGLRDEGALAGALARPRMAAYYQGADLAEQAALLIAGIALAHAFVDGNKRTGLITGDVFLDRNGLLFEADPARIAGAIVALVEAEHAEGRASRFAELAGLIGRDSHAQ